MQDSQAEPAGPQGSPPPAPAARRPPPEDFLSGESGTLGPRRMLAARALDGFDDALRTLSGRRRALRAAAAADAAARPVHVLAIGAWRPQHSALTAAIAAELKSSRHELTLRSADPLGRGKFEVLNDLLPSAEELLGYDWLLAIDDDVLLPHGFLDDFIFLCRRFHADLAQPAHRRASHAAWRLTRRRPGCVLRETCFVEIGPVTAFARSTFGRLLPFPPVRMGWGLDAHWAALAQAENWRLAIADAVPIGHSSAPAASAYSRQAAIAEAQALLADRPYLPARASQRTLRSHHRWRRPG